MILTIILVFLILLLLGMNIYVFWYINSGQINQPPSATDPPGVSTMKSYLPFLQFDRCKKQCKKNKKYRFLSDLRCSKDCVDKHLSGCKWQ